MLARRTVAFLCFVAFVVLGITSSILGPTLTNLTASINLPIADAGILRGVQQIGSVVATFAGGYFLGRYSLRNVIAPSVILMAIGLVGIVGTSNLSLVLAADLILGVGTGLLNVAANVAISTLYSDHAAPVLSALHTCFGLGLFAGPLIAGQMLARPDTWRITYILPAAACVILGVLFVRVPTASQIRAGRPSGSAPEAEMPASRPAIRWLPLLPLIVLLFVYNGAGNGVSDWIAPHLELLGGVNAGTAAQIASLYGLALTAGRAIGIVVLHRFASLRVVAAGLGLAVLGAALIVLAGPTVGFIAFGVALVGLGFSPIYPNVIALAGQQQPDNRGVVTGIVAGIASVGGIIMPVIQGWVGGGQSGGMIVTLLAALIMVGAFTQVPRPSGSAERRLAVG